MCKTSTELFQEYGKSITPQELGKFLGLDPRTVKKYFYFWGGIEVSPGKVRFFEPTVKEILDGKLNKQKGEVKISWKGDGKGGSARKTFSRCINKIKEGSNSLGKRRKRKNGKETISDNFGIFDDR